MNVLSSPDIHNYVIHLGKPDCTGHTLTVLANIITNKMSLATFYEFDYKTLWTHY